MLLRGLLIALVAMTLAACQPGQQRQASPDTMTVAEAQFALDQQGYQPGPMDGIMGQRTVAALERFQRERTLPVTGRLDPATVRALRGLAPRTGQQVATASPTPAAAPARAGTLRDAQRLVRAKFWPANLQPVDLNDDGMTDYIVAATYDSGFCGAYLCSHMVLLNRNGGFVPLVDEVLATAITASSRRTRGFRDLIFQGAIGNAGASTTWRWNGRSYGR